VRKREGQKWFVRSANPTKGGEFYKKKKASPLTEGITKELSMEILQLSEKTCMKDPVKKEDKTHLFFGKEGIARKGNEGIERSVPIIRK